MRFLYGAANQLTTAIQLATLQQMGGPDRADDASLFMMKVRNDSEVQSTRAWAERAVPGVSAISTSSALAQVDRRLSYFRQLAIILGTVSLFVGFLLVTTLMTVSVNERISEITVMRALGVSRTHVVQQIALKGIFITIGGAIAGLGLGLITAPYLSGILSSFPGLSVGIDFSLFQPKAAWMSLGLLSLSGIAAGVYPSYRAASLPIATTLRQEAPAARLNLEARCALALAVDHGAAPRCPAIVAAGGAGPSCNPQCTNRYCSSTLAVTSAKRSRSASLSRTPVKFASI